jgi:hypothetical protein
VSYKMMNSGEAKLGAVERVTSAGPGLEYMLFLPDGYVVPVGSTEERAKEVLYVFNLGLQAYWEGRR